MTLARIDTHSHYYGEALFRRLAARQTVPRLERAGSDRFMITPTSRFAVSGGFIDISTRLAWMKRQGIGHQLITFPGALGPDVLPPNEAVPLVRDVNDELAAVCNAYPEKFTALAGLPLADVDLAVTELERARSALGLRGAIIPGNYFSSLVKMDRLRPVLAAADTLHAHLMVHPGHRHDEDLAPRQYDDLTMHRASTIDLHADITHAVITLIHSDMARQYPNLSIQVVNLGGAFPMLVERMDHVVATRDPRAPRPSTLVGQLVFDTASLGPHSLELAVAVLGAERIMLGTDYPIFDSTITSDALTTASIPETARAAVAAGNALRVLRLSPTTPFDHTRFL